MTEEMTSFISQYRLNTLHKLVQACAKPGAELLGYSFGGRR